MAKSNGLFFQVIEVPPLAGTGFEVRVIHSRDFLKVRLAIGLGQADPFPFDAVAPIAVINKFVNVAFQQTISDIGAGSITLDLDSDLWDQTLPNGEPALALLEYGHLWRIYEDGLLRAEFLGLNINETKADSSERRGVTISGPDQAEVLKWYGVLSPYYPGKPPAGTRDKYEFHTSTMHAWLHLLGEAQKQDFITWVDHTFGISKDSNGKPWPDLPPPKPKIDNITEMLQADITFASGSYALFEAAEARLVGIGQSIQHFKSPEVTLVGHTDSTSSHAFNQTLSEQRANACADVIRRECPHARLNISGKGETQPIATNATPIGREKNRRVVVTYPRGPVEVEVPALKYELGDTLYDLLNQWTGQNLDEVSAVRAEWFMYPGARLAVIQDGFGTHREKEVVFYEGSTALYTKARERARAEIRNVVNQPQNGGGWTVVTDAQSTFQWHKRMIFNKVAVAFDETRRANVAQTILAQNKDETSQWSLKVAPYAQGRRIFRDYNIGDWIGISQFNRTGPSRVDAFRVMGISMSVGTDNNVDLELTLQSVRQAALRKLQIRMTNLLKKKDQTEVWIQDDEPVYARVGDFWTPMTDGGG